MSYKKPVLNVLRYLISISDVQILLLFFLIRLIQPTTCQVNTFLSIYDIRIRPKLIDNLYAYHISCPWIILFNFSTYYIVYYNIMLNVTVQFYV